MKWRSRFVPTAGVVVSTKGVKGAQCLKYTEFIQELVGREESRTLTSEYYEPEGKVRISQQQKH